LTAEEQGHPTLPAAHLCRKWGATWEVAVAENDVPRKTVSHISLEGFKTKWIDIFQQSLKDIFDAARISGVRLTPDKAMAMLDDDVAAFEKAGGLEGNAGSASPSLPALRIDVVAIRRKVHHCAVDLFYNTYFPRKAGTEGKPRRGAPSLSDEYLDQILQLCRKGLNYAQIADRLGEPKDRIRKRIEIAERRYREAVERVRELGAAQLRKNGPPERALRKRVHARKRQTSGPRADKT
jgi:hypothetical protein